MSETIDQVAGTYIYPVKGARFATQNGEPISVVEMGQTGFEVDGFEDRGVVLYDVVGKTFVSTRGWDADRHLAHRGDHVLATVDVDIRPDGLYVASHIGATLLPRVAQGDQVTIDIFEKKFAGRPIDDDGYFSKLLGRPIVPLYTDHTKPRMMSARNRREGAVVCIAGQDGKPISIENLASWRALLAQYPELELTEHDIMRTRPNIVLRGEALGAFQEDYIDSTVAIYVGAVAMLLLGALPRCPVPNFKITDGNYDGKVTKLLRDRVGTAATGDKVELFFGQAFTHIWQPGQTVSAGDPVRIPALAGEPNVKLRVK